ncbi:MAG: hypothetical protein WCS16_02365, partial [Desulfuromonas sp.]
MLLLALVLFVGCGVEAFAAPEIELKRVRIEQDVNTVRIVLGFDRIPSYELTTSGQKIEIILLDTFVRAGVTV